GQASLLQGIVVPGRQPARIAEPGVLARRRRGGRRRRRRRAERLGNGRPAGREQQRDADRERRKERKGARTQGRKKAKKARTLLSLFAFLRLCDLASLR